MSSYVKNYWGKTGDARSRVRRRAGCSTDFRTRLRWLYFPTVGSFVSIRRSQAKFGHVFSFETDVRPVARYGGVQPIVFKIVKHVRVAITHNRVPLQSHVDFFDQIANQVVLQDAIVVRAVFQVHFKSQFRGTKDVAQVVRDGDFSAFAFDGFWHLEMSV